MDADTTDHARPTPIARPSSRSPADSGSGSAARCSVCGGELSRHLDDVIDPVTRELFAIDQCGRCGLGHTRPVPPHASRYYGPRYHGNRRGFTDKYCTRRRLRLLSRVRRQRGGALLDVGCGDGAFLGAAQRRGWNVCGTEMNPSTAREAGFTVGETLADVAGEAPFDCVTMWHSLEHMVDLTGFLVEVVTMMRPGGALLVAVPDAGGLQARLFGRCWFHLDVPRHVHHFDCGSLEASLRARGLVIERRYHQEFEYDAIGWVQSTLNCVLTDPNVLFELLTGKRPDAGLVTKATSLLGALVLTPVAIPAVLIGTLVRRGGTLIVVARRPAS